MAKLRAQDVPGRTAGRRVGWNIDSSAAVMSSGILITMTHRAELQMGAEHRFQAALRHAGAYYSHPYRILFSYFLNARHSLKQGEVVALVGTEAADHGWNALRNSGLARVVRGRLVRAPAFADLLAA